MSTSTSKTEELQATYYRLLSNLVPEEFAVSAELSKLLDDAIRVLQAELEFKKIFEAAELVSVWGDAMRNETTDSINAEERGKNEKVGEATLYLDGVYWEMNEASLAILERRESAKEAVAAMAECRKEIIRKISHLISEKTHESLASIAAVFDYPLRPDIAIIPDSLTYELIALRKEIYDEPAWSIETALTSKDYYLRRIMYYRYQLSFGKHFADHYKNLQEK